MLFFLISFITVLVVALSCYSGSFYMISVLKLLFCKGGFWCSLAVFDGVSFFILIMLGVCFFYVASYMHHYFGGSMSGFDLSKMVMIFVSVMAVLVTTGDFLTTLIFWEYLGVVSYFLILFYLSYLSLRASVITVVSSRFGDVCLFFVIALSFWCGMNKLAWVMLFFFIVLTKSASFPFISWLLEAMRAPTPVSSLVHSSTLVAAGVWFSMRYDLVFYSDKVYIMYFCMLMTIFMTGTCCFFFLDLKKMVALSTCKKMAWCVFYLMYGDILLSLFQLVSHGVSKCLLFMLVGDIMSGTEGSQASNCIYSSPLYGPWGIFSLFSIMLGLSGAPFIGVFFTKHLLLSGFSSFIKLPVFLFITLCVFLSYLYSFRLCAIISKVKISVSSGTYFLCGSGVMVYLWLALNYFTGSTVDEKFIGFSWVIIGMLMFQIMSTLVSYFLYASVMFSWWSSSLFGCDNLVEHSFELFKSLRLILGQFYYRWDKECMTLLVMSSGNLGIESLKNLIKILMSLLMFMLTCFYMLY